MLWVSSLHLQVTSCSSNHYLRTFTYCPWAGDKVPASKHTVHIIWLIKSRNSVQSINLVLRRSCKGMCIYFTSRVWFLHATYWAVTWKLIFHCFFSLSGRRTQIALGERDYDVSKWHLASKRGSLVYRQTWILLSRRRRERENKSYYRLIPIWAGSVETASKDSLRSLPCFCVFLGGVTLNSFWMPRLKPITFLY